MRGFVITLSVALAACDGAGRRADAYQGPHVEIPATSCAAVAVDTAGWKTAREGDFSFRVPPGYQPEDVRGIDSQVGRWAASERRFVAFDYGPYSDTLDRAESMLRDYSECGISTGRINGKVVAGYDTAGHWHGGGPQYVVAATWRDVHPGTHLTLNAASDDAGDVPALYAIVRSVRFSR